MAQHHQQQGHVKSPAKNPGPFAGLEETLKKNHLPGHAQTHTAGTPQAFGDLIRREIPRWAEVVRAGFGALLGARLAAGASAAAVIPLAMAWIGDVVPYERRQPVLARMVPARPWVSRTHTSRARSRSGNSSICAWRAARTARC